MAKREDRAVPIAVPPGELVLDGLFNAAADGEERGAVIAPPHPLYGGSMDSPVVSELAWCFSRAGRARANPLENGGRIIGRRTHAVNTDFVHPPPGG